MTAGVELARNDRQQQRGAMQMVMVDGLVGDAGIRLGLIGAVLAGVEVPVEPREVGAGDMETDRVALLKDIARLPKRNFLGVVLPGSSSEVCSRKLRKRARREPSVMIMDLPSGTHRRG